MKDLREGETDLGQGVAENRVDPTTVPAVDFEVIRTMGVARKTTTVPTVEGPHPAVAVMLNGKYFVLRVPMAEHFARGILAAVAGSRS